MTVISPANQLFALARQLTVCSIQQIPPSGSPPTAQSFIGTVKSITLKPPVRVYASSKTLTDIAQSTRVAEWGEGSLTIEAFSATAGSISMALYALGGHANLLLTETSTGDLYQVLLRMESIEKKFVEKEHNMDSLTFPIEGIPQYGPAGTSLAAMVLE